MRREQRWRRGHHDFGAGHSRSDSGTARPRRYFVVAQPVGGSPIQGVGNLIVTAKSRTPEVGERAIPSHTPTIASTHGNFSLLTTASPPDRALLRYSVADSLGEHVPFVL